MAESPEALARAHRAQVAAVEAVVTRSLVDAYSAAWRRLKDQITATAARIAEAEESAVPGLTRRGEALRSLEAQVAAEIGAIARNAGAALTAAQWQVVRMAEAHAREATEAAMGEPPAGVSLSFALLPAEAVRQLVGSLADGTPLSDLLGELGPDAAKQVREALTTGLATGESTASISRRVRSAFGGNAVRAVTVVRTEVLRSYRRASWESYRANGDVVRGWRWLAALTSRSCAACIAMHGTEHGLDEEFHDHPRGRCSPAPVVRTWAEQGHDVPDVTTDVGSGEEWFARQPADVQRKVLSPAKAAAYDAGAITLADLAGSARSRKWGKTLVERSLTEAIGATRTRGFIARARAPATGPPASVEPKMTPAGEAKLDRMYAAAAERKPAFDAALERVAGDVGGTAILPGLKGRPRAVEKIVQDYAGDPGEVKDLLRATISVRSVVEADAAVRAIGNRFTVVKSRNLLDPTVGPMPGGYRDAKLNVSIDGHVAEVQVSIPEMLAAKKRAHPLYEKWRSLTGKIQSEKRAATVTEERVLDRLRAEQEAVYEPVWRRALAATTRASN